MAMTKEELEKQKKDAVSGLKIIGTLAIIGAIIATVGVMFESWVSLLGFALLGGFLGGGYLLFLDYHACISGGYEVED